jgi:hypothetical protein
MQVPPLGDNLKSHGRSTDIHGMAAHDLPAFDPAIIERYVENTYRKATAVFLGSVVAGVMIGAAFGAIPLTSLGESWPIPQMFGFATMLLGAIAGGVVGYLIGDTRAFLARLQGQTALAQIEAAKDARLALETVLQIQAVAMRRAVSAAKAQQPPQQSPPVAAPEPAPAPAPAPAPPLAAAPPLVAATPAPLEVASEPAQLAAPVTAPASLEVAPVPATASLEVAPAPPAPPTLVVAAAPAEPAPPLMPPLSS